MPKKDDRPRRGSMVEFHRETSKGNKIPTNGFVRNVMDAKEYNCTHTYLAIEYYAGKSKAVYHAKEKDVTLISQPKEVTYSYPDQNDE